MHTNIDQHTTDEKIHQFMAKRTPLRTLSRLLTDRFSQTKSHLSPVKGIRYEPLDWTKSIH